MHTQIVDIGFFTITKGVFANRFNRIAKFVNNSLHTEAHTLSNLIQNCQSYTSFQGITAS